MTENKTPMRALTNLQKRFSIWREKNFGLGPKELDCFLGAVEEVGELAHVLLKSKQNIRGWDDHVKKVAAKKDAVADIIIFLFGFCDSHGWDMGKLLLETGEDVLKRDWRKYPKTGKPPLSVQQQAMQEITRIRELPQSVKELVFRKLTHG